MFKMKKWVLKAIVQKVISILPFSHQLNFWFQKNITKGVHLTDEHFNDKLVHCFDHLEIVQNAEKKICFELGTGWYPVIPVGLFLSGCEKTISIDVSALCNKERILTTITKFKEWHQKGKLQFYIPNLKAERWDEFIKISDQDSFDEILNKLQIELIVGDARKINLEDNSIDFICSNNVFEHIYPEILSPILSEFGRVLKADGVMSHFIDMSDHFAHSDNSISIYNYLKFSDSYWRWIDNSVQPQNRMRIDQYSSIFKELNFNFNYFNTREGYVDILKNISVNQKYSNIKLENIAISHTHVTLYGNPH